MPSAVNLLSNGDFAATEPAAGYTRPQPIGWSRDTGIADGDISGVDPVPALPDGLK